MNRIKMLREEKNMSQEELGEIIGKTGQAVGQYESGKRDLSTDILRTLAKLFDVTTDYLLGLSDERISPPKINVNIDNVDLINKYNFSKEDIETGKKLKEFFELNPGFNFAFELEKLGIKSEDLYTLTDAEKQEIKRFIDYIKHSKKYNSEEEALNAPDED